ncbi:hypothetical protein [Prauserella sp. PE36]|uniref:hypothetical protein n=1 Tax=Prauserella sp. PE36 TaxID=1504709 RepID=UPI0011BE35D1|nr:hypothetical protein [Prauserella sp. PE36]
MSDISSILESRSSWLDELPKYQRDLIRELGRSGDLEAAARSWLEAGSVSHTAEFGVLGGARVFYEKVLDELHDLLCVASKYTEEKAKILQEYKAGQASFVAMVTSFIAPHVGTSSPLLAPVVAVILTIIAQASLKTWCSMQVERRSRREADDAP